MNYLMDVNKNYNESCLVTMSNMSDSSIDMVITSPPYDDIRSYKNNIKTIFHIIILYKRWLIFVLHLPNLIQVL